VREERRKVGRVPGPIPATDGKFIDWAAAGAAMSISFWRAELPISGLRRGSCFGCRSGCLLATGNRRGAWNGRSKMINASACAWRCPGG